MAVHLRVGVEPLPEGFPPRVVEKIADLVAQKKKPFVLHERYGYQTTNEYPKSSYVFQVDRGAAWPLSDRARGNAQALEVNVLAVAATKPFQLRVGSGAVFPCSADGGLYRVSFDDAGLLLTRIGADQAIVFDGLDADDSVQVHVELYPAFMCTAGHDGRVSSDTTMRFAVEGRCFMYTGGKVAPRDTLPPGMPSWLEFLPIITDENKAESAAAARVRTEPDWTPGEVAAAIVAARSEKHLPYFTVDADTGDFRTAGQGVKYACCHAVPAGVRFDVATTSIVRQVQCPAMFSLRAGPNCATTLQARSAGGVWVVDIPHGMPATKQSPCAIFVWPGTNQGCGGNEASGGGGGSGGGSTFAGGGGGIDDQRRVHPTCTVTFLCEAIGKPGSAPVQALERIVVQAVSSRHVIVSLPAYPSPSGPAPAAAGAAAAATAAARATRPPAPLATAAATSELSARPARKTAPTVSRLAP